MTYKSKWYWKHKYPYLDRLKKRKGTPHYSDPNSIEKTIPN